MITWVAKNRDKILRGGEAHIFSLGGRKNRASAAFRYFLTNKTNIYRKRFELKSYIFSIVFLVHLKDSSFQEFLLRSALSGRVSGPCANKLSTTKTNLRAAVDVLTKIWSEFIRIEIQKRFSLRDSISIPGWIEVYMYRTEVCIYIWRGRGPG